MINRFFLLFLIPLSMFIGCSNPPVINEFSAETTNIIQGSSTFLIWKVDGASATFINESHVPFEGILTVSPTSSTTYTLTASNNAGFVSKSVEIAVMVPPVVQVPPSTPVTSTPASASVPTSTPTPTTTPTTTSKPTQPNRLPIISEIIFGNKSITITPNTVPAFCSRGTWSGDITCVAIDPDNGNLNYAWQTTSGTIKGSGAKINYLSTSEPGKYFITVAVTNGKGASTKIQFSVQIHCCSDCP